MTEDKLIDCEKKPKSYLQKVAETYRKDSMLNKFYIWLNKLNKSKKEVKQNEKRKEN